MATAPRRTAAPCVEWLEERALPAGGVTARLAHGVLRIDGTEGKDTIRVRQVNQQIRIDHTLIQTSATRRVAQVASEQVGRIEVRARGGDDLVHVSTTLGRGQRFSVPSLIVWAGAGNDTVIGGAGNDRLHGGAGNDRLTGGAGRDVLFGEAGHDVLRGGAGRDVLHGGDGNDMLLGGAGDDRLEGGGGRNRLRGEQGNDLLISRNRLDEINGGPGRDTVRRESSEAGQTPFHQESSRMLELVNQHRRRHGLRGLRLDPMLTRAARYQSDIMARTGHYQHTNPDGRDLADRLQAAGYAYRWAGETIHRYNPASRRTEGLPQEYPRSRLPDYFVDGWKVSPPHNVILLDSRAVEAGVGLTQAANGLIYAALVLGEPA